MHALKLCTYVPGSRVRRRGTRRSSQSLAQVQKQLNRILKQKNRLTTARVRYQPVWPGRNLISCHSIPTERPWLMTRTQILWTGTILKKGTEGKVYCV